MDASSSGNITLPPKITPPSIFHKRDGFHDIDWRTMILNWIGTMVLIGLVSPAIVWYVVYRIRLKKRRRKLLIDEARKTKGWISSKSVVKAAESELKDQVMSEIRPSVPSAGIAVQASKEAVEPTTQEPIITEPKQRILNQGRTITKPTQWITKARQWIPNPKQRSMKPEQRLKKRDHFCHYMGWWSTSADQRSSLDVDGAECIGLTNPRPAVHEQRMWEMFRSNRSHGVSIENLAEQGKVPTRPLPSILEVVPPPTVISGFRAGDRDQYVMVGALGSEGSGISDTVRRRPVARKQLEEWKDLSHHLRRSATRGLLTSSRQVEDSAETENPETETPAIHVTSDGDSAALGITPKLRSLESVLRLSIPPPKLRKVHSSPALRSQFDAGDLDACVLPVASSSVDLVSEPWMRQTSNQQVPVHRLDGYLDGRNLLQRKVLRDTTNGRITTSPAPKVEFSIGKAVPAYTKATAECPPPTLQRKAWDSPSISLIVSKHRARNKIKKASVPRLQSLIPKPSSNRSFSFNASAKSVLDVPDWVTGNLEKQKQTPAPVSPEAETGKDDNDDDDDVHREDQARLDIENITLAGYEETDDVLDLAAASSSSAGVCGQRAQSGSTATSTTCSIDTFSPISITAGMLDGCTGDGAKPGGPGDGAGDAPEMSSHEDDDGSDYLSHVHPPWSTSGDGGAQQPQTQQQPGGRQSSSGKSTSFEVEVRVTSFPKWRQASRGQVQV